MNPIHEQRSLEILIAAARRWADAPPLELKVTGQEAWTLLGALQLALRHPSMPSSVLYGILTDVGRRLQTLVCDRPELQEIAERGWDPAYDVEAGGNPGLPSVQPQVAPRSDLALVERWRRMIVSETELNAADKLIALLLAAHATMRLELEARISIAQLSETAQMTTSAVLRALAHLADRKLIVRSRGGAIVRDVEAPRLYILRFPTEPDRLDAPEAGR